MPNSSLTRPCSSLTLAAGAAAAQTLTPGATATAAVDLGAAADGTVVPLVATVTQGPRTATATVHVTVDRAPLKPSFAGGFYKVNEPVTLTATLPEGSPATTKVDFAVGGKSVGSAAPAASVATLTAPALSLGTGDVSVTATASDAQGNGASATATVTVGLLHGSAGEAIDGAALAVDSPGGQGVLWNANGGALRYAKAGGGAEVTLALE